MSSSINKSVFRFVGFNIIESYIKRYPSGKNRGELQVEMDLSAIVNRTENTFVLNMAGEFKDEGVFEARISAVGHFQFEGEILEELGNYFYVNSPALLFPHIRAYLAAMTSLSGMSSILIPAMNLSGLSEDLKKNTQIVD